MTDDLQQARVEAAAEAICETRPHSGGGSLVTYEDAVDFARAALAAADAHLPSVEQIAGVIRDDGWTCDFHEPDAGCLQCKRVHEATARKIAALFGEVTGDEEA